MYRKMIIPNRLILSMYIINPKATTKNNTDKMLKKIQQVNLKWNTKNVQIMQKHT